MSNSFGGTRRQFLRQAATLGLGLSGCGRWPIDDSSPPAAVLVLLADTHSAHSSYPSLLAAVDEVVAAADGEALILFNGDVFERGNVVTRRGHGHLDLQFVQALSRRAPLVFNLGNHEGALEPIADAADRLRDAGAAVVSNITDTATGRSLADPAVRLRLAGHRLAVAGLATSNYATYRAEVRSTIRVDEGPAYAATQLGALMDGAELGIVLSHEGVALDRTMLPALPRGTLLAGAHDHLHFHHQQDGLLYVHPGHWGATASVITLHDGPSGPSWQHRPLPIPHPGDAEFATNVARAEDELLEAEDREAMGWLPAALGWQDAALLAVEAVRDHAGADVAMIGNTTFGAGLPAGSVSRHAFDAFLRFENALYVAQVPAGVLQAILRRVNQFGDVDFARRIGEYAVASPVQLRDVASYTLAVDGWIRLNSQRYLGAALELREVGGPGLREVVLRRLREQDPSNPGPA